MIFDQFKKIAELKKLQDEIKKETMTVEKRGVAVTMNGAFEVVDLKLNPELSIDEQQQTLKQCLNQVREDLQKKLAQKMMGSGLGF